ncbi:hypothetical protein CKO51_11880 [Rhodopirellula sp. SM50]|nr:hypothetical protein CKO51_11880 [Rhodopirellula sp. SM50]
MLQVAIDAAEQSVGKVEPWIAKVKFFRWFLKNSIQSREAIVTDTGGACPSFRLRIDDGLQRRGD